jgi:hypothetical protein
MRFNLEFIIALLVALYATYLVNYGTPNLNPYITFLLLPLTVAYIMVLIINNIFPSINAWGNRMYNYSETIVLSEINETGYIQLFPPIFIVLIIFALMLYNGMLG